MVERILNDIAAAGGANVGVLRYFNVAGADPAGRSGQVSRSATHLIKIAAEVATGKRQHVVITGCDFNTIDGTGVRDYIHVSDLAAAHLDALDAMRASPKQSLTLNVGYGRGASVLEVLDAVERVSGRPVARINADRRPGDVASLVANIDRLKQQLKWNPRYANLDQIVGDAIAWEQTLSSQ